MEVDSRGTELSHVIRIDDERVRDHLGRIVRGTVDETLNAMLEAEADRLSGAGRYERTAARRDQRFDSYDRKLQTKAGEVTLKVTKLRRLDVEPQQENLRPDRSLAEPAERGSSTLTPPRRHRAQTQLGRPGARRLVAGGDLGQRRRLPSDSRHRRGWQGRTGPAGAPSGPFQGSGLAGVVLIVSDACMGLTPLTLAVALP
jgi:hypothetical protein